MYAIPAALTACIALLPDPVSRPRIREVKTKVERLLGTMVGRFGDDTQSGVSVADRRAATKNTRIVVVVSRVRLNHANARKALVSETAYSVYGISYFGML